MNRKKWIIAVLLSTILLSGCSMQTIDQLYCLPKRPEGYMNQQSALEKAMADLSYHAPIAGENRQSVQNKDLDGDGKDEYLVFAKGSGETPLKILVFRQVGEAFVLADTLEGSGTAFEQVQYVHFSDRDGYDLVVTRQISDQGVRPLAVYTMENGKMVLISTMNYMRFLATDLDADGLDELMILQRGENAAANGKVSLLTYRDGAAHSNEADLSVPADSIRRILINRLVNGERAVYLTGEVDDTTVVTDVISLSDQGLTNITISANSGFSEGTKCDYPVYPSDMDGDGVLELPELLNNTDDNASHHMIHWYALNSDGSKVTKGYTFHNFGGGWYLDIPVTVAQQLSYHSLGEGFEFVLQQESAEPEVLMSVFAFTGSEREEFAVADNRFELYRNESTVFAGRLEVVSAAFGITQNYLTDAFHLIPSDQLV